MWRIRYFFESVTNLFRWLPTIWSDRQWDNTFIYKILLQKIFLMRVYFERRQFFVGWENEVKWMKTCERLLTDLIESNYWKDEYDTKHLNIRNMNLTDGEMKFFMQSDDLKVAHSADLREKKATELLFKIISWRHIYWWD